MFNELEVKFLCAIQYELAVSPEDIELAEGALQIVRVPCDEACEIKKRKVEVLQEHTNQSGVVGGVAACNNSVDREVKKVDNSTENGAANNYKKVDVKSTDRVSSACLGGSNNYTQEIVPQPALCPKLAHTACYQAPNDIAQDAKASDVKDRTECTMAHMPPQPTKMSTPERRGSYTLIAIAAE